VSDASGFGGGYLRSSAPDMVEREGRKKGRRSGASRVEKGKRENVVTEGILSQLSLEECRDSSGKGAGPEREFGIEGSSVG